MQDKYYVYALANPLDNLPFYIGKGCGDRVYSHLTKSTNLRVRDAIVVLKELNLEPKIVIHQGNLSEDEALWIEEVLISALGRQTHKTEDRCVLGHPVLYNVRARGWKRKPCSIKYQTGKNPKRGWKLGVARGKWTEERKPRGSPSEQAIEKNKLAKERNFLLRVEQVDKERFKEAILNRIPRYVIKDQFGISDKILNKLMEVLNLHDEVNKIKGIVKLKRNSASRGFVFNK